MLQGLILTSFCPLPAHFCGKDNLQEQQHIHSTFKLQVDVSLTGTWLAI